MNKRMIEQADEFIVRLLETTPEALARTDTYWLTSIRAVIALIASEEEPEERMVMLARMAALASFAFEWNERHVAADEAYREATGK